MKLGWKNSMPKGATPKTQHTTQDNQQQQQTSTSAAAATVASPTSSNSTPQQQQSHIIALSVGSPSRSSSSSSSHTPPTSHRHSHQFHHPPLHLPSPSSSPSLATSVMVVSSAPVCPSPPTVTRSVTANPAKPSFAATVEQVMMKKKKKKWYQLGGKEVAAGEGEEDYALTHTASTSALYPSPLSTVSPSLSSPTTATSSPSSLPSLKFFVRKHKMLEKDKKAKRLSQTNITPTHTARGSTSRLSSSAVHSASATTSPTATSPSSSSAVTSLKLPIDAIVSRPAFASSFRSFLVTKYCQENIDFLLAVEKFNKQYEVEHPAWKTKDLPAHFITSDVTSSSSSASYYDASLTSAAVAPHPGHHRSTSVSIAVRNDKSTYTPLDFDAELPINHSPSTTGISPLSSTAANSSTAASTTPHRNSTPANLPKTALEIYHTYILLSGPHSVNIPASTRSTIENTVNALQQQQASKGNDGVPLSTLLTPALFDEAVVDIKKLLEREWLCKFYATPQYSVLMQWMDKKEREVLMKLEAAKAKKKLQEQLKKVAAAVRTPAVSGLLAANGTKGTLAAQQRASQSVSTTATTTSSTTTAGAVTPVPLHLSSQAGGVPTTPPSPVSTLRPSDVIAAEQRDRSQSDLHLREEEDEQDREEQRDVIHIANENAVNTDTEDSEWIVSGGRSRANHSQIVTPRQAQQQAQGQTPVQPQSPSTEEPVSPLYPPAYLSVLPGGSPRPINTPLFHAAQKHEEEEKPVILEQRLPPSTPLRSHKSISAPPSNNSSTMTSPPNLANVTTATTVDESTNEPSPPSSSRSRPSSFVSVSSASSPSLNTSASFRSPSVASQDSPCAATVTRFHRGNRVSRSNTPASRSSQYQPSAKKRLSINSEPLPICWDEADINTADTNRQQSSSSVVDQTTEMSTSKRLSLTMMEQRNQHEPLLLTDFEPITEATTAVTAQAGTTAVVDDSSPLVGQQPHHRHTHSHSHSESHNSSSDMLMSATHTTQPLQSSPECSLSSHEHHALSVNTSALAASTSLSSHSPTPSPLFASSGEWTDEQHTREKPQTTPRQQSLPITSAPPQASSSPQKEASQSQSQSHSRTRTPSYHHVKVNRHGPSQGSKTSPSPTPTKVFSSTATSQAVVQTSIPAPRAEAAAVVAALVTATADDDDHEDDELFAAAGGVDGQRFFSVEVAESDED